MAARTFRDPTLAACYAVARRMAADNFSNWYYSKGELGPRWPHRGAGHRDAYWTGRLSEGNYIFDSPLYPG